MTMMRLSIIIILFYLSHGVFSQLFQRNEKFIFPETKTGKLTVPEERWSFPPKVKKREHLIAVPARKKSQVPTSHGCKLLCFFVEEEKRNEEWSCQWMATKSRCHVLTREIMRSARTFDHSIPYEDFGYLVNRTTSKLFIQTSDIAYNYGSKITKFEDGFLADYPHLYGFAAHDHPIRKLNDGMFEGVEQIKWLEICNCPYLSEINQSLQNLRYLEYLFLFGNSIRTIKATYFTNLTSLIFLDLLENGIWKETA